MNEVSQAGRTVFFVSHSMSAIQRLCKRVIVLASGNIKADTSVDGAIAEYLSIDVPNCYSGRASSNRPSITEASVAMDDEDIHLRVGFHSPFPLSPPVLGFVMYDPLGNAVFGTNSRVERFPTGIQRMSSGYIDVMIPSGNLRPNQYFISLWLADQYMDYCSLDKAIQVQVDGGGARADLPSQVVGSVHLPTRWRYQAESIPDSSLALAGAGWMATLLAVNRRWTDDRQEAVLVDRRVAFSQNCGQIPALVDDSQIDIRRQSAACTARCQHFRFGGRVWDMARRNDRGHRGCSWRKPTLFPVRQL
jgi:hypothetical protein